jgi:hypothetical protein
MMMISGTDLQQDTVPRKIDINQDSTRTKSDSASAVLPVQTKDSVKNKLIIIPQKTFVDNTDTTSVCTRNIIADVTYYDFNSFVFRLGYGSYKKFPFVFIEKGRKKEMESRALLIKHLKTGMEMPAQPFHSDWRIIIILIVAILFSLIKATVKNVLPDVTRFFMVKGKNDSVSRDIGGLFNWQSTILNLVSFFIIGLFAYSAASYYNFIPPDSKGIVFWLISLGIVISAITLRHIICLITGTVSGEEEAFREYLLGIYQSYRFGAFILFIVIILMSYTIIFPVRDYILSGIIIMGLVYLLSVIRLFLIFLNRNISIFYLILYLCALEILPVLVAVKYYKGLV